MTNPVRSLLCAGLLCVPLLVQAGTTVAGIELADGVQSRVSAHFRSEAAQLAFGEDAPPESLRLCGRIAQCSYPGGYYRYAVAIGERLFMVDDQRRLRVGDAVDVCLSAEHIHIYNLGEDNVGRHGARQTH